MKSRPRKDHRGVDLISDALPFGRLWYVEPNAVSNAIGYAMHSSRSYDGLIRVYDDARNRNRAVQNTRPISQRREFLLCRVTTTSS